ncbi:unnamed protein product [Microthlaspi erraticum]|uniref:Uncharacterized protein n=1 Tax=Microthlaspi erraticum TaxID=1685480 RepID=A0A6D2KIA0_9BRAS|nr:unnamed protein product [Microthlaspi erraticum]
MFRARPNHIRPSEVSAKVQTDRPITHTTRETLPAVGQASTPTRTTAREPGNKPRGRATVRVPRPMHPSEPGKNVPRPAENFIGQISSVDHAGRPRIHPTPTVPTRPRPDCPADRPARPSQRRGRPEALFEAQTYVFKPGLTLSRL